MSQNIQMKTAYLGAGCFWSVEETFRTTPGVVKTEVGYQGGHTQNPTYQQVCYTETGHAEVVAITFDPTRITYDRILDIFWDIHDPTTLNRQGPDVGTQYRSAIFYADQDQKRRVEASKAHYSHMCTASIVTEITEASSFWPAEEYHQKYIAKKRGLL